MAKDNVVTVFYTDGRVEEVAIDPARMSRAWMESQVGGAQLEIIGCEEDELTDGNYQPLFYLIVNMYDDGLVRNRAVDARCPETVKRVTSYPRYDAPHERRTMGFSGRVLMIPKSLLPELLPEPASSGGSEATC